MNDPQPERLSGGSHSRRAFLGGVGKTTLMGALLLSAGGGMAWLTSSRAARALDPRYRVLRKRDVEFFDAVLPAIITQAGTDEDRDTFLASLDSMLSPFSVDALGRLRGLIDFLSGVATRVPMTGTATDWPDLSTEQIGGILSMWQRSEREIPNVAYSTVTGVTALAWYMVPENQLVSGYPGPPKKVVG